MENPVNDTEILRRILCTLSDPQIEELCLSFPPETPLGDAFRQKLKAWRRAEEKEDRDLRTMILEVLGKDSSFTTFFYKELRKFMRRQGFNPDDRKARARFYNAAEIPQNTFSVMMNKGLDASNNRTFGTAHASRENVLKMALVLKLNIFELKDLLCCAGMSFSPGTNPTDYVIAKCVRNGEFDLHRVDELLYENNLPTLSKE